MSWLTAIPGALKLVPRWVWPLLAVALLWGLAMRWHAAQVQAVWNDGYAAAKADVAKASAQLDAAAPAIVAPIREKHDEESRRIAADADGLRLRGPGKAICAAVVSGGAGRPDAAGGTGDAAVAPLLDGGGPGVVALPFAGTVAFAEQHDAFRAEALAWREWHRKFTAWWATVQGRSVTAQPNVHALGQRPERRAAAG